MQSDSDDYNQAVASGDKAGAAKAKQNVHDDYKTLKTDGVSTQDIQALRANVHSNSTASLAGAVASGKLQPDDKALGASLKRNFGDWCKTNGKDPSDPTSWDSFAQQKTGELQQQGLSASQAQTALNTAQSMPNPQPMSSSVMRNIRA